MIKITPEKVLVSRCLLGDCVRYDGHSQCVIDSRLQQLLEQNRIIAVCPECDGGLTVPRSPCEIQPDYSAADVLAGRAKVCTQNHNDCTEAYVKGACTALERAREHLIKVAILKAKSPSCGNHFVYNGRFEGKLVQGRGIAAELLTQNGITVFNEHELDNLFQNLPLHL